MAAGVGRSGVSSAAIDDCKEEVMVNLLEAAVWLLSDLTIHNQFTLS